MSILTSPKALHTPVLTTVGLFAAGSCLLFVAAFLMLGHAFVFQHLEDALPAAARIPELETRLKVIKEQVEISQLHASLQTGSPEERLHVYVLPEKTQHDRLLALFELMRDALTKKKVLRSLGALSFGERRPAEMDGASTLTVEPVTVSVVATEEGIRQFLTLIKLSGVLTLGDALTKQEQDQLLRRTEADNPAGVVSLGQFLSTDFLDYLRDSRTYDDRLRKFFSSEDFLATLQSIHQSPIFSDGQTLLRSPLGDALATQKLWPIQFLEVQESTFKELSDGWYELSVTLNAYSR